jgi:hypothetical protein
MAFFRRDPSGNHCRNMKYVVEIVMRNGSLKRKRKMWIGRYIPAGCDETGKNGAIPDPLRNALVKIQI